MNIDGADILAILEERPYLEEELADLFGTSADVVRDALKQLHRSCAVKRVGAERRWALLTYQAPTERPHLTKPARIRALVSADADEEPGDEVPLDRDDAAPDPDDDIVDDVPEPPQRGQRLGDHGRRLYPVGTRHTPTKKAKAADTPAWWVAFAAPDQRDAFITAAAARDVEMREKSATWKTQTKPNEPL